MRTNSARFFWGTLLALTFVRVASAYTYIYADDNMPVRWLPGSIPMHIKLGFGATSDGLNYSGSVQAAMTAWNSNLSTVQFQPIVEVQGSGTDNDGTTQVFFSNAIYGTSFDSSTLAITLVQSSGNETIEADMIFNTAYAWDSYRGNRSGGQPYDIQRVALHELGHVLGLDHPDQATDGSDTSVVAIMRSIVSNSSGPGYDSLAPDDILGAQNLYGASGGAAPANDNFASAPAITLVSGFGQAAGSNIYPNSASRESGEPQIAGNAGGHSVWWKWTAPTTGTATIDTRGSLFDTILGVYTGSVVNALTLVAENDDENNPGGIITSLVSFPAVGGTTYYIAVDGFFYPPANNYFPGETGKIQLHINHTISGVVPTISNPSDTTVNAGVAAHFAVVVTGTPTPTLQWQYKPVGGSTFTNLTSGGPDGNSGITSTQLIINATGIQMTGNQYRCVATNSAGSVTSAAATLTVNSVPPGVLVLPLSQTVFEGSNATFVAYVDAGTPPYTVAWQVLTVGGSWTTVTNGNGYGGATTEILSLTSIPFALNGNSYRCIVSLVSNPAINTTSWSVLLTVVPTYGIVTVASGFRHGLFVKRDGTLWAMGMNQQGALGDGTTADQFTPEQETTSVVAAAGGNFHSLFIKTNGTLWGMGSNFDGELGLGNSGNHYLSPVQISTGVVAAAAEDGFSCFVKADGTLWAMGRYGYSSLPTQVASDVISVSAGGGFMLFLKGDGSAWGIGTNAYGQLGNGSTSDAATPIMFASNVAAISAGPEHGMILKNDGSVWTFGRNSNAQLGDGTNASRASPVQIGNGGIAISAGGTRSYFVKSDNTLWGAGTDNLGNGTGVGSATPIQLASGVADVSSRLFQDYYVKTDGSLWSWGSNTFGALGDGFNITRLSAVRVALGAMAGPAAPTNLSAVVSLGISGAQRLTWNTSIGASRYEVWRNTVSNFSSATRLGSNLTSAIFYDVSPLLGTNYYWVTAVNPAGAAVSSLLAVVTSAAPVITSQPSNREASPGGIPTFAVTATGGPTPTLQWQRLPAGGGGWADLSNSGSYAGVTTATLTVSNLTLGMNGDQFRCVATNINGTATSNAATLTVGSLVAGDFNFDRQKDLIWENTATGERALWLMHGTVYVSAMSFGIISPDWRIVGAADFNGDGKTDILWENTSTGDRSVWLMDGVNHVSTVDMGIVSPAWHMTALADFNGDHQTDIMVENTSTGERVVWLMNGTNVDSTISYGTIPTAWRIAGSADFNHDGQIDIVWENTSTGQHAIWLMNGTVFQSAIDFGAIPAQWRLATVGDFNGDGDVDFFWENTVTGDRALWLMHGTVFSASIYFGIIPTDWNITP